MRKNISPWVHQLDATRAQKRLASDVATDVAIIGAGIAGTATAYFALKYTSEQVVMIDRFKLAHGATGHNAGAVVSYFERGFASMVQEFGEELAAAGQRSIDDAWELLDEMYSDASLDIPFSRFIGHGGLTSYEQVMWHVKNSYAKRSAGVRYSIVHIATESRIAERIPAEYAGLFDAVPHEDVLAMLETGVRDYVAVVSSQKGCINSALFCQEVVAFLLKKYPNRFALYEHTPIHKILLRRDGATLDADTHVVTANRVVLCTNGFENLHIINETGLDIDAKYHHLLEGVVGYMSGYLEKMNKLPIAISYYAEPNAGADDAYIYLTRRPYEFDKGTEHNLVSIGGPEMHLDETAAYSLESEYPDEMEEKIDTFVRSVYSFEPNRKIDYVFTWHGLMGYTKNRMRMVGPEPQNPVLLYNLGCNGIGILPSVYGGRKIARHLAGERVGRTIFDIPARDSQVVSPMDLPGASVEIT